MHERLTRGDAWTAATRSPAHAAQPHQLVEPGLLPNGCLSEMYCVYFLDRSGWLLDFEFFDADSDEQAVAAVKASKPGAICRIWADRRLVAKIGANPFSAENDLLPLHGLSAS